MNLNKKGYMLIEIILSSVLAMSIAYYLLNLTYKFKNTDQDIYQSIISISDKNLITKNIMNDIENEAILDITCEEQEITEENVSCNWIDIIIKSETETQIVKRLMLDKNDNNTILKYGKYETNYITNDVSYYEKEIDNSTMVGKINIYTGQYSKNIEIPIESIYGNESYNIKLFFPITEKPPI